MNKTEPDDQNNQISRKKFLRTVGSIFAGGSIVGVSGALLTKKTTTGTPGSSLRLSEEDAFVSPYKPVSSFAAQGIVKGFEQHDDKLYVAVANAVCVYDHYGKLLHRFSAGELIRDIAVNDEGIYLLYPAKIEVYSLDGTLMREWEACSELSNYCSFALASDFVFVTDMENKNICKYTAEGNFVKFIKSPNGFIIPSLTFGIESIDGTLYCSNSGRHLVENYTLDGEYIASFGEPGHDLGLFNGCCNPVHLTHTENGDIITSEKGNPRISCYGKDGTFRSLLLNSKTLGGGRVAYDVKVQDDKLFVAGKHMISVFQYGKALASVTSCSGCKVSCPLREGVNV